jgi:hypothetical protein
MSLVGGPDGHIRSIPGICNPRPFPTGGSIYFEEIKGAPGGSKPYRTTRLLALSLEYMGLQNLGLTNGCGANGFSVDEK